MFFFQHPLADFVVGMNDLEFIDRLWADWSPGYDGAQDIASMKDALRDPQHLAAAIEYYRATLDPAAHTTPAYQALEDAIGQAPTQPHLYLHGRTDGCMGADLAEAAAPMVTQLELVPGAGHFLHLERPDAVNRIIVDFLTS
jgi:pimeloyl-ACP methyl ester carboxylesterase